MVDPDVIRPNNVYTTDGYSIENAIVSADSFVRILSEVHNIVDWTDEERERVVAHFNEQLASFQEILTPLMAQIAVWRRDSAPANLNNLDLSSLFAFEDGFIVAREEYGDCSARIGRLSECVGAGASDQDVLEDMEAAFRRCGGRHRLVRGKYLIWFFAMIANEIHRNIANFVASYTRPPKSKMTFGPKNVLVVAAPRARIPASLRAFIEAGFLRHIDSKA